MKDTIYFLNAFQFVILVVDSTDRERLSITKEELHKMMAHDELNRANILVFANKQVIIITKQCQERSLKFLADYKNKISITHILILGCKWLYECRRNLKAAKPAIHAKPPMAHSSLLCVVRRRSISRLRVDRQQYKWKAVINAS